jgi:hypothetical protein
MPAAGSVRIKKLAENISRLLGRRIQGPFDRRAGGLSLRLNDHIDLSLAARSGLNAELWFLADVYRGSLPERRAALEGPHVDGTPRAPGQRPHPVQVTGLLAETALPDPRLAEAILRAGVPPRDYAPVEEWLTWIPARRWRAMDPGLWPFLLDLDDPAGPIHAADLGDMVSPAAALADDPVDDVLAFHAANVLPGREQAAGFGVNLLNGGLTMINPRGNLSNGLLFLRDRVARRPGGSAEEADRHALRALLKLLGIPERLVTTADGAPLLQAWEEGAWRDVVLPVRAPPAAAPADAPAADAAPDAGGRPR